LLQSQIQDEFIKKLRKPIFFEQGPSDFQSFTLRFGGYLNENRFGEWFKYFASINRKQIFRIKGIVHFEGSPLTGIVQSVGGMTGISEGSVANPFEPIENVLVFIGTDISKFEIESMFNQFLSQQN
jgi:G3E family GTPase